MNANLELIHHLLTQGPEAALKLLKELNELIDGENCRTDVEMDDRGEKASAELLTRLNKMEKEEVFTILASMSAVQNISEFLYDDISNYITKRWGDSALLAEFMGESKN